MIQATNNNELNSLISKNRQALTGISIIAILLYHAYVWITPQDNNLLKLFTYGYAGVDIFMFLSGWGLCFSYSKNRISSFYFRRYTYFPAYYFVWTDSISICLPIWRGYHLLGCDLHS